MYQIKQSSVLFISTDFHIRNEFMIALIRYKDDESHFYYFVYFNKRHLAAKGLRDRRHNPIGQIQLNPPSSLLPACTLAKLPGG
jgi:hypothetical protein